MPDSDSRVQHPWPSYQDILSADRNPAPSDMRQDTRPNFGLGGVPVERYIGADFHRLEIERMWSKVWQFACREEEIPEPGDVVVYELADLSFIITRTEGGEIKAFFNSCLHRGTKLCAGDTHVKSLRCPFHGFTWSLDGRLQEVPCRWDFPHVRDEEYRLPEAKTAVWAGFVFINMDPDARPLEEQLEDLPQQLAITDYGNRYLAGYYRKTLPANWKACMEAFLEAYHVMETHNHSWLFSGDVNTQYDVFPGRRFTSRFLEPLGVLSPIYPTKVDEQGILDSMIGVIDGGTPPTLPEGMTARYFMAEGSRRRLTEQTGVDHSRVSDAEAIDSNQYLLFPNMVLFRGLNLPVVYRFRPNGNNPDSCIFDLLVLEPIAKGQQRPEPAQLWDLGEQSFVEAGALPSWLGFLYDQDTTNLGLQQRGLHTSRRREVTLSEYQEVRIRHFHDTLGSFVGK